MGCGKGKKFFSSREKSMKKDTEKNKVHSDIKDLKEIIIELL